MRFLDRIGELVDCTAMEKLANPHKQEFKRRILRKYFVRLHMFLIPAVTIASASLPAECFCIVASTR